MSKMSLPNYTQISNSFLDSMHEYSGSAVKVFMAISRKTIGWHKVSDKISYSQLRKLTGLSTNSIKKSVTELQNDEWITISGDETFGYIYDLNMGAISKNDIVDEETISNNDTSTALTISNNDTTKERDIKKDNIKKLIPVLVSEFDGWWEGYPRKDKRATTFELYKKHRKKYTAEDMLLARDNYLYANRKAERQYIRMPSTFLNAKGDFVDWIYPPIEDTPDICPEVQARIAECLA